MGRKVVIMTLAWIPRQLSLFVGLVVSMIALIWLLHLPFRNYNFINGVGFACSVICLSAVIAILGPSYCLSLARKQDWSPTECQRQGLYLGIYLVVFGGLGRGSAWLAVPIGLSIGLSTGLILRKQVYPTLADEQAFASRKLPTIFNA